MRALSPASPASTESAAEPAPILRETPSRQPRLASWVTELLAEARTGLSILYGRRLHALYLFGSHARGEATRDSDVDLAIVLASVADYAAEIERTSELIATLARRYDTSVSRVFVSNDDWMRGEGPFLISARADAVAA